uniref:Tetratricopeptide repeat protein n=1 Tax=Desertifilum tharense IPPAS B-1220 TaxID=1781255 RepID=A0ACD5H053_9CYAN
MGRGINGSAIAIIELLRSDNNMNDSEQTPEFWENRGCRLCQTEAYEDAIAAFDRAIALNPNYPPAWNHRGNALSALKRYPQALASYDKAVALNPQYHQAWFNRGLLFNDMQAYGNAIESYQRALAIHPDPRYIHAQAGIGLHKKLFTI